jgi:cytochrome c-type biogenesis protein CcmH
MSNLPFRLAAGRSRGRLRLLLTPLTLLLLLVLAQATVAQDVVTDDEVNEIAKEVYCPVCENTPLDVCETRACADWRELIRTKLGEGQSKQQIFDYFANQYGDRVLASPPKEGFNLILWTWPIFALALGAILFGRYLRQLKAATEQTQLKKVKATSSPPTSDDDYVARIEKELSER